MLFVSPYKLFFFSKFVNFCLDAFGHIGIRLDRKAKVTFKFMMSSTGKQIITINILPNISKNKGNQTIKFVQLIEYNAIYIFLRRSCRKCCREASSRPLLIFYKAL